MVHWVIISEMIYTYSFPKIKIVKGGNITISKNVGHNNV